MSLTLEGTLLLVGAGNMGGAMLAGWLEQGLDPRMIAVQDPSPPKPMQVLLDRHSIAASRSVVLARPPAIIVMAVKPQLMDQVYPAVASLAGPATVVLSVAAGKTIASFEKHLPPKAAVVRSIPNTPASVGRGITVAVANAYVTDRQKSLCDALLKSVGAVAWVDDEALIDAVTAVSGSGPAYVFYLAECMAEAGIKAGLPADLARLLARWTVAGAGELLHRSDLDPGKLRENVTSPNGTTHAALQVLMGEAGMQPLFDAAIAAATRRSKELAG